MITHYLETDKNAPMDVIMTLTKQLLSLENDTLAHTLESILFNNDQENYTVIPIKIYFKTYKCL